MRKFFLVSIALVSLFFTQSYGQAGLLDSTLDADGILLTSADTSVSNTARSVWVLPDKKIMATGPCGDYKIWVGRFNEDGSYDKSFNTTGLAFLSSASGVQVESIIAQPDGKTIIAGTHFVGSGNTFMLARFKPNGSLDSSFNDSGIVKTNLGLWAFIDQIVLQADGKIVALGASKTFGAITLARYKSNGLLDSTFGTDGISSISVAGALLHFNSIKIQADGKFVIGGGLSPSSSLSAATIRLNSNGSLDPTYKTSFFTGLTGSTEITNLALQFDGKVVATGYHDDGLNAKFITIRYKDDGNFDSSFGLNGIVEQDIRTKYDRAQAVLVQSDGKIIVSGYSLANTGFQNDFAVLRYLNDGTLDTTFGTAGITINQLANNGSAILAMDFCPDNKIVCVGFAINDSYRNQIAVTRYWLDAEILGLSQIEKQHVSCTVFPNPCKESLILKIDANAQAILGVQLVDAAGRLVNTIYSESQASNKGLLSIDVDMHSLPTGNYWILLQDKGHTIAVKKITKE
ncbi:MAG: T9SS type A sorting domain-containing protein [Chitinophagaceae bacterium]|nr:T9SS type A sorting domain-containing protein [Chitinophagaceae bacterium]